MEHRSANGEDFAKEVSDLHEHVKLKLQDSSERYKQKADFKRRELQFNVGDLILAHLCKERTKDEYNKLKWKKIGPCKILWNFFVNVDELQLPPGIGISPIFNVADLYPYTATDEEDSSETRTWDTEKENDSWIKQMPPAKPLEIEHILDT